MNWQEEIPMVPDANCFDDASPHQREAQFVAMGVCQDLQTHDQYIRAKMVVAVYPKEFMVMRHERDRYIPRIYAVGGNWVAAMEFVQSGADTSWEGVSVGE